MEENKKISLELCFGTACFVMGASGLQDIETQIPPQYRSRVDVKASTCLDLCKDSTSLKAPFVKIDGEVMSEATVEKILQVIESKINEQ